MLTIPHDNINDLQWWETPGWVTWYYLKKPWDWRLTSLLEMQSSWQHCSAQSLDCAVHSQNPEIVCQSQDCAANLEIAQPIWRLQNTFVQSQDCAGAICKCSRLMGWEHLSWLMEESWELSEMVKPSTQALYRSGVSLHLYPDQGEGSFSELANFPEVLDVGPQELLMYVPYHNKWWKLEWWPEFWTQIVWSRYCRITPRVQSRDWHAVSGLWECAAQSQDGINS